METRPPGGATPVDPDEAEDLLPLHVTTRAELDELEEANIQIGMVWALRRTIASSRQADVLSADFVYALHERMFGQVWRWAGQIRRSEKNIGVERHLIRAEVQNLIEDARMWRERGVYSADEIAIRFHHRLVAIHPFANGNGRHARLMADLLSMQSGRPAFSWGGGRLTSTTELRSAYITALRKADGGDMAPLLEFARS